MDRKRFLKIGAATCAVGPAMMANAETANPLEIIDCHTHFYDPTRPQGVPWPRENDTQLYRPVLPSHLKAIAGPVGVTGTVVVEASAWVEDNQWVLDLAKDEPFIVGLVGRVEPGEPDFAQHIKRLAANPLFRGIRVSGGKVERLTEEAMLRDLEVLAEHDLSLDVNGGTSSLPTVAAVAKALPDFRIVINHLANLRVDGEAPPEEWLSGMDATSQRPSISIKISGLVEGTGKRDGSAPSNVDFYRPVLDAAWERFGPDRVIYGNNWPVSELFADYATVFGIVHAYVEKKGETAMRKFFAENAGRVYKWVERTGIRTYLHPPGAA
jgi:predicted TIM-barrel fold metal-dependent hydrolase